MYHFFRWGHFPSLRRQHGAGWRPSTCVFGGRFARRFSKLSEDPHVLGTHGGCRRAQLLMFMFIRIVMVNFKCGYEILWNTMNHGEQKLVNWEWYINDCSNAPLIHDKASYYSIDWGLSRSRQILLAKTAQVSHGNISDWCHRETLWPTGIVSNMGTRNVWFRSLNPHFRLFSGHTFHF